MYAIAILVKFEKHKNNVINTEKMANMKTFNKITHIRHEFMAIGENKFEMHHQPLYYLHSPANVNKKVIKRKI